MRKDRKIKLDKFLKLLSETGNVTKSALSAKIDKSYIYQLRKDDSDFAEKMSESRMIAFELLEEEAIRRAVEGVDKNIYYNGKVIDSIKVYSDQILLTLLKANAPEKYSKHIVNHNPDIAHLLNKSISKLKK